MELAESRKRKREEYEMQLFGFHSRTVHATLKNAIMERIQSKNRKLCDTLEKTNQVDVKDLEVVRTCVEQLSKAYCTASLPHVKSIENIVIRFINVPPNVLANEDKVQATQYTEAEFKNIQKKLDNLQQRAKRATILNAALKEELQLIEQFSINVNDVSKLSHVIENSVTSCPDISDKIRQLVENYKKLHSALSIEKSVSQKTLYNTINNLKSIDGDMDDL